MRCLPRALAWRPCGGCSALARAAPRCGGRRPQDVMSLRRTRRSAHHAPAHQAPLD